MFVGHTRGKSVFVVMMMMVEQETMVMWLRVMRKVRIVAKMKMMGERWVSHSVIVIELLGRGMSKRVQQSWRWPIGSYKWYCSIMANIHQSGR